jgi:transposase InsO family protein
MTKDDVLFGYRLQIFALAERTSVAHACRTFGIHRSTYYAWRALAQRHGLEMLRPRERRRPRMPNQLSKLTEQRIVAFALGHPQMGPHRMAAELGREKWGAIQVSGNGVWRVLCRHGINTRTKRLGLIAGYAADLHPAPHPPLEPQHIEVERPGQLVGIDCFYVGRLRGTRDPVWQVTAIDVRSSFGWAALVPCPNGQPTSMQTSRLVRRIAADLARCGWRLERVLSDNGNEFKGAFATTIEELDAHQTRIRPGRPQTNGHVENLNKTILDECWRPAFARALYPTFTGLARDLHEYLDTYNYDRPHHGRLTNGAIPADIIDPARKMRTDP